MSKPMLDPNYLSLATVLQAAYDQAATGKGKERHANGLPWTEQPIFQIAELSGVGFNVGQSIKKLQESIGMASRGEHEAAKREVLGAIVYAASVYVLYDQASPTKTKNGERK